MVYVISWRPSSRVHQLVSLYQLDIGLREPQILCWREGEGTHLCCCGEIQYLGHPARNPVTALTEKS
jgi:hypothetical protein